ncbi:MULTISPECIES: lytic polysaccharide monooxygenase [Nocardia]|uniref:lytic polysaccharide monooxygenase n=1 Tax=Nocardia TaxID=1817 RepID=UPI00255CFC8D|nr:MULTISPECIES: lytic polysaccharide monooxygenase [Nocardia]
MSRRTMLSFVGAAGLAPLIVAALPAAPASAHGYISSPASRQAQCAQNQLPCGPIKYEPQSVEGPKGQRNCSAGDARWKDLDDDSKPWKVHQVGSSMNFTWTFTARHATSNWEYWVGGKRVTVVDGGGRQPGQTATHTVNLSGLSGRQKLIGIWNIADTPNAFYSCVDIQIGSGPNPTTTTNPPTTTPPTTTPPTTTTNPNPGGQQWKSGTTYATGDVVTYDGARYRCLQPHTAQDGWTPPSTPALWQKV